MVLGLLDVVALQDKTSKSEAKSTQDTVKQHRDNSQKVVDNRNETRKQSTKR